MMGDDGYELEEHRRGNGTEGGGGGGGGKGVETRGMVAQNKWEFGTGTQVRYGDGAGRWGEGGDNRKILCTTEVVIDRELRKGVGFSG